MELHPSQEPQARRKFATFVQSEPDDFLLQQIFLRGISMLKNSTLAYDILIHTRHLPGSKIR